MLDDKAEVVKVEILDAGALRVLCKTPKDAVALAAVMHQLVSRTTKIIIMGDEVICHLPRRQP